MLESQIISTAATVADKFDELEQRLDNHINQETEQEAAHEAAGREMRAKINLHSETRVAEMQAAYAHRRREESLANRAAAIALREVQREKFWIRAYVSSLAAALFLLGVAFETIATDLGIVGTLVSAGYCCGNFVAYATRNIRKGE